MRSSTLSVLGLTILSHTASAIQTPDIQTPNIQTPDIQAPEIDSPNLQPYLTAIPQLFSSEFTPNLPYDARDAPLVARASSNNCPNDFNSCANLGAANLCCIQGAVCAVDSLNQVACCPSGAVCTGSINGVITSGTIDGSGGLVSATAASGGLVTVSTVASASPMTTTGGNGGFVTIGQTTVASLGAAPKRSAEMPFLAQLVIQLVGYLPL